MLDIEVFMNIYCVIESEVDTSVMSFLLTCLLFGYYYGIRKLVVEKPGYLTDVTDFNSL